MFVLDGYATVAGARHTASSISMVGDKKFVLTDDAIKNLEITPDQMGKGSKYSMTFHVNKTELSVVIAKEKISEGTTISGKANRVELYAGSFCKQILALIGKKLAGSGTIGFRGIEYDKSPDGVPYAVIDLRSYSANAGVFVDEVTVDNEEKWRVKK